MTKQRLGDDPNPFPPLPDDDARRLVENILRLRRQADQNPNIAVSIPRMTRELSEGIGGWAIHRLAHTVSARAFGALPIARRRAAIATHAQYGIVPPGADKELKAAMLALNRGDANPVVQKAATRRRGPQTWDVADLELKLLSWIAFQQGYGGRSAAKIALDDVTAVVGQKPATIRKWRNGLRDPYGARDVAAWLAQKKSEGRAAKERGEPPMPLDLMEEAALALKKIKARTRRMPITTTKGRN